MNKIYRIKINNSNNKSKVYFKNILKIFYLFKIMSLTKYNRILKIKIIRQNKLIQMALKKINKILKQFSNKIAILARAN